MSHRIGILHEGADADVVLWDSHPLQLGATPQKVWIDGILQVGSEEEGVIVGKGKEGEEFQEVPKVPNWDAEREAAVKWEGLPPLTPIKEDGRVVFRNVKELWVRRDNDIQEVLSGVGVHGEAELADVVMDSGRVTCVGKHCLGGINARAVVDLHGGSISPSFMSYGSPLGMEEIASEPSTGDGKLFDPFTDELPSIMDDQAGVVRAADALQFGTRNAL